MIVGANPLVSVSMNGFDTRNPLKRLKQAKARGMKLIVIDPRRTETARFADVFLQPLPGEDCAILAGLIHIILAEGWQDHEFCARYAGDLDALRAAVAPFTPAYVARRADVPEADLRRVAEVFARDSRRGAVSSATGPDMSPGSNLAEHLIECLNVICGRFVREGETVPHPGAIMPRWPRKAEVIPAPRWWEHGYRSRIGGFGLIDGELPTGILADEILEPGAGQVRALIVHGGNPASAVPDQERIVEALRSLELLVTIEPFMTQTARLSHYVLPPTLQYERADLPIFIYENLVSHEPVHALHAARRATARRRRGAGRLGLFLGTGATARADARALRRGAGHAREADHGRGAGYRRAPRTGCLCRTAARRARHDARRRTAARRARRSRIAAPLQPRAR